jgi:ABC-2 type transport system ATP-binding protein
VLGILLPSQQDLLERSGPWDIVGGIDVPTMFVQGTVDVLFPLQQALNNAVGMPTNQANIRMIWYCGGHGACLTLTPDQLEQQDQFLADNTIAFLNNALPEADGTPNDVVTIPKFQFVDQNGKWYTADFLPVDVNDPQVDDFYTDSTPIVTQGNGGLLAIVPVLGGSGPQSLAGFPASLGLGSQATNAISVPLDDAAVGTQVVGAPQLTMTYSGIGTSRHVYAQVVDKKTGLVVGNIVTPLPVTLDGRTHTQTYSMEDIVWTYGDTVPDASDLELQIVGSATPYLNFTEYGYIDVKDVSVSMPTPGPNVVHDLEEEDTLAVSA